MGDNYKLWFNNGYIKSTAADVLLHTITTGKKEDVLYEARSPEQDGIVHFCKPMIKFVIYSISYQCFYSWNESDVV